MLPRILIGVVLVLMLWPVLRYALGLRAAKLAREETRRQAEAGGRRVVAEIPVGDGVLFFLEDHAGFYWAGAQAFKRDLAGGRLLLNGAAMAEAARPGAVLPERPMPEEYEGRERWDVILYLRSGEGLVVPCGTLREGVSREAGNRVFQSVRQALSEEASA
jgi:hypothetical protein